MDEGVAPRMRNKQKTLNRIFHFNQPNRLGLPSLLGRLVSSSAVFAAASAVAQANPPQRPRLPGATDAGTLSQEQSFASVQGFLPFKKRLSLSSGTPAPFASHEFINKDCAKTNSCDLKSFKLEVYKTSSVQAELDPTADDITYGDMMVASYETRDLGSLEKYGIVQFIKGCSLTHWNINGKAETVINTQRGFFDFNVPFIHPNWVLDSLDTDPVYASVQYDPSLYSSIPKSQWKRLAAYRINKPNPFANETSADQAVFQYKSPTEPRLYISDYPTFSYGAKDRRSKNYSNSSMKMRTCVFKLADVPQVAKPDWNDAGKAIACFEWANNHRYDSVRDRFVDAKDVDPLCTDTKFAERFAIEQNTPPTEKALNWTKKSQDYGLQPNSCDASFGALTSTGYFAGDVCAQDFYRSIDPAPFMQFLKVIGRDKREIPNQFLSRRLLQGGLTSINFSAIRLPTVGDMSAIFKDLKARAIDVVTAQAVRTGDTELNASFVRRMSSLQVRFLQQGAGCDNGSELRADYDPVINAILVCPAWTHLPNEALVEMLSEQIAAVLDVCSIRPIYTMRAPFIKDLKTAKPQFVAACFKPDPDLRSSAVVGIVLQNLEATVDDGRTDFEGIQDDIDQALLKCQLIEPSKSSPLPKDFSASLVADLWTCARKASGDKSPSAPIAKPWKDKNACSFRNRDMMQSALGADLLSYYLRAHPEVVSADAKSALLFSTLHQTCAQQGLTDPRGIRFTGATGAFPESS